jgi:hypothetical protein
MEKKDKFPNPTDSGYPQINREVPPHQKAEIVERLREEQNPINGMVSGLFAAFMGAVIWAVVTFVTKNQIGWMAIGIAYIVGWSIRRWGKGVDAYFGIMGAIFSFLGCLLGNIFSIAIILSQYALSDLPSILWSFFLHPNILLFLIQETFSVYDILFYGIAIYYGYRYSIRAYTIDRSILQNADAPPIVPLEEEEENNSKKRKYILSLVVILMLLGLIILGLLGTK